MLSGHHRLSGPCISQTGRLRLREGKSLAQVRSVSWGKVGRAPQVLDPDLTHSGARAPSPMWFWHSPGHTSGSRNPAAFHWEFTACGLFTNSCPAGSDVLNDHLHPWTQPLAFGTIPQGNDQKIKRSICVKMFQQSQLFHGKLATAALMPQRKGLATMKDKRPGMLFCPLNEKQVTRAKKNQENG